MAHTTNHNSPEEINNMINYVIQMPKEFKNRIFTDLLQVKNIHKTLYKNHNYDDWFLRSGRDWEDYGL